MTLQTTSQVKRRDQLAVKVAEVKEVQSRLEIKQAELITAYDSQTMVATEWEQLCTQIGNKTTESVEVESTVKRSERPAKCSIVSR